MVTYGQLLIGEGVSMKKSDENMEFLFKCIVAVDNVEDCERFLEDLCSMSELQEMSRRIKAARMLRDGYVYSEIAAQTGLSTATISRVNRCLKYGNNGYITVLDRLERMKKY